MRRREPLRFSLRVMGRPVDVAVEAPPERARLDELLPALRALADAVVAGTVAAAEAEGRHVSCRAGCAACCKGHPVSVTPPEAAALARLVDRMPEPRRSAVRARFAVAVAKLQTAGVHQVFLEPESVTTAEQANEVVRRYSALDLHCPFLEGGACGIYADRPFVCRQYMVTSPPELCDDPLGNPIERLHPPVGMAGALLRAVEALTGAPEHTVPLVLALDHAARRRGDLGRKYDSRAAIGEVMGHVAAG
ncbi:MAG TPA: YkgJ family cysteine cluster protein [Caulobacteraceae bacterium]|jgi:Fe-S-cluster containining protein